MKNLKKTMLTSCFILIATITFAQIGIGTTSPSTSAALDVTSTDKGMLVPRMNTTQRTTISSPATGLLVFDETSDTFWFKATDGWVELANSSTIATFATNTGVTSNQNGAYASDDFVFGSPQLNDNGTTTDHDNRMFFDKSKGAFRAGKVTGTNWDADSLGNYSVAFGIDTKALGNRSTAIGSNTTATGSHSTAMGRWTEATADHSTAMGYVTKATGDYSTAMGYHSDATNIYSTAMGYFTMATGKTSTTMGRETTAESYLETAIGSLNTDYTPIGISSWNDADRLFVIGNGQSSGTKSNALIIYKNGTMNINDAYNMPTVDGSANQVLNTDGSGNLGWADITDDQTLSLSGATLSIEDGNSVNLTNIDNDDQTLSLSGTTLSIEDGNSVDISTVAIVNTAPGNSQFNGQSASIDLQGSMELSGTAKVFGNVVLANAPNKTTTIGNDGNAFNAIIKVTEYMDVSNISSGNSVWVTFPVSKAALDGAVSISPAGPLADKIVIAQAYVSAVGEVRVNFRNTGGSSYNPSGMNYYISVIQ